MREILTGIFTWPWFSEPHVYNFNGHFIRHFDGNLCVDPVEPSDEDLAGTGAAGGCAHSYHQSQSLAGGQ